MRLGGFISLALHVGFAVAGMIAAPYLVNEESTRMMILPVDLEIAESTNVKPSTEDVSEEDKMAETPEVESFAAPTPPPAAEAEEVLPDEKAKPDPKKPDPKKAEASTAPAPKNTLQSLSDITKDIDRKASDERLTPGPKPSLQNVDDAGPRTGTGDMKRMTATVADAIMSQLKARCWGDQDDMADSRRLGAVIAVQFGRDGHIKGQMKLIEPTREPTNDPPMQVFILRARTALNQCNVRGFQVPPEYFQTNPPAIIELNFKP
jgi:outer membrane biosynthesis protein TonB